MGYHCLRLVELGKGFSSFGGFALCGKSPKPADFLLLSVFFPHLTNTAFPFALSPPHLVELK